MENKISIVQAISKLEKNSNVKDFHSGEEQLDDYIKKFAWQNQKRNISDTYIITTQVDAKIIGYYTLGLKTIPKNDLSSDEQKGLPKFEIPVVILGKLAVDKSARKQRIGEKLLLDAMRITYECNIPVYGLITDAINENVKEFYKKYNFKEFSTNKMRLLINKENIGKELEIYGIIKSKETQKVKA